MEIFISMSQKGQNNWKELTVWVKCVKSEKKKKSLSEECNVFTQMGGKMSLFHLSALVFNLI